ncbi:MAG: flagellar assembly protein FliW [Clostridia bacterium]|nr:flagellar assembly protein FliW [Clostridia bacterium]
MKISNEKLKDLQINQKDVIHFKEGVPGFEKFKDYVLLQEQEIPFVMTLQSIDAEFPSFVVIDPYAFIQNYNPKLSKKDLKYFECEKEEDLRVLLITVVPKKLEEAVVNLKSPIIINAKTNKAKQFILENTDYPIRYRLFDEKK